MRNRNVKNSVASARSRTAIAVASSALGIATGLNDVMGAS
jgi:hypothetical protein